MPITTPQDYQHAIAQTFERLEQTRRAPKILQAHTAHWVEHKGPRVVGAGVFMVGVGIFVGGISFIGLMKPQPLEITVLSLGTFVGGIVSMVTGIAIRGTHEDEYSRNKWRNLIDPVLGMAGHTMPLDTLQAKRLNEWSQKHPRLLDVIARWAETTPDLTLGHSDFRAVDKAITKVEKLEALKTSAVSFEGTGIGSALKRGRLNAIAQSSGQNPDPDTPTQSSNTPRM